MTQKMLVGKMNVGCGGLCGTHDGSLVGAEGALGKASAGSWRCQLGWPQVEDPSWTGGLGGEPSHSACPEQLGWQAQQRNTWNRATLDVTERELEKHWHIVTVPQIHPFIPVFFCILRFIGIGLKHRWIQCQPSFWHFNTKHKIFIIWHTLSCY